MDNLEKLQEMWQSQAPDAGHTLDDKNVLDSVLGKIKQTEKKVLQKNRFKTIVVIILSAFFIWNLSLINLNLISITGVVIILLAIITFMLIYWKIQFKSSELNYSLPQNQFIDDTIIKIQKHKSQTIKLFMGFVFILIIAMNLFYWELLINEKPVLRIAMHLGISFFFLLTGIIGLKIRERKFNKEFKPLIDELTSVKK